MMNFMVKGHTLFIMEKSMKVSSRKGKSGKELEKELNGERERKRGGGKGERERKRRGSRKSPDRNH